MDESVDGIVICGKVGMRGYEVGDMVKVSRIEVELGGSPTLERC